MRDILRRVCSEHEVEILSGTVARDHVHVFVSYRPMQRVSQIVLWEMVREHIEEQEGEALHDDSRFPIDP